MAHVPQQPTEKQITVADQPVRKKVKRRPARKQVTLEQAAAVKKQPEQNGQTYNVWYNKWAGGDRFDSSTQKEKSQTRCRIATDAGYTRADGGNNAYCCLYFARGCCPYGSECSFLHRLPPAQSSLPDASLDVFGREKHSDYRDDMGGVGSFSRQNRTLYIGRLREINSKTEELVETHFQEWGEIERIRVLHGRGVAFVTYVSELNAQFAKEAMMCQSMVDEEVLNVRWATEDPNPAAKRSEHARIVKMGSERIAAKMNPELVEAVEALDRLEQEGSEDGLQKKRPQIDADNDHDESESKRTRQHSPPPLPSLPTPAEPSLDQVLPPPPQNGLLSSEAIQGLRSLAASNLALKLQPLSSSKKSPLVGLADYGSDDDDST
ncbi:Pre-mRNA-splicing factor, variant 2 [Puccinia graminis f. sp. tritici]|uniref:Pre-mRNA-splicing factor, variant 2 n=1 Tax=Puccinia graminis f. sp. tritici TaxID=56615 RepID=A0A5B0PSV7_PUCGR|nr:Pre-mRNA-splicing factor, variant 2 [Puccinia graminis f. sp. tritici]